MIRIVIGRRALSAVALPLALALGFSTLGASGAGATTRAAPTISIQVPKVKLPAQKPVMAKVTVRHLDAPVKWKSSFQFFAGRDNIQVQQSSSDTAGVLLKNGTNSIEIAPKGLVGLAGRGSLTIRLMTADGTFAGKRTVVLQSKAAISITGGTQWRHGTTRLRGGADENLEGKQLTVFYKAKRQKRYHRIGYTTRVAEGRWMYASDRFDRGHVYVGYADRYVLPSRSKKQHLGASYLR